MKSTKVKEILKPAAGQSSRAEQTRRSTIAPPLILLLCFLISGCATDKAAYQRAERRNTVESWQEFISQYPNSKYLQEAKAELSGAERRKQEEERRKQEELRAAWESATQKNSLPGYWEVWQKTKGKGEFADKARSSIRKSVAETIKPLISGDVKNLREVADFPIWFFSARDICLVFPSGRSIPCRYTYSARVTIQQTATGRLTEAVGLQTAGVNMSLPPIVTVTNSSDPSITMILYSLPDEYACSLDVEYKAPPGSVDTGNALQQGFGDGALMLEPDGTASLKAQNVTLSINAAKAPYKLLGNCVAVVRNKEITSVFPFGNAKKLLFEQ